MISVPSRCLHEPVPAVHRRGGDTPLLHVLANVEEQLRYSAHILTSSLLK